MPYTLDTQDLEKLLSSDRYLFYENGGVYAIDSLPMNVINKKCFIVNTDPSYLAGKTLGSYIFPSKFTS